MNRLVSSLLATAFVAAGAGAAFAAASPEATTPAPTANPAQAQPMHHPKAMAAAKRLDRSDPKEARITHALNLLEAKGYGSFSDFKPNGKNFDATVTSNGQHFAVTIDPDNDQITRKS